MASSLALAAAPDHTVKDRQNPDQDLGVPALQRVRHSVSRIISHGSTMPPSVVYTGEHPAYALRARAPEMPPNSHQQPTIATSSNLQT